MNVPIYIRRLNDGEHVQAYSPDLFGLSATASSEREVLELIRERLEELFSHTRVMTPPPGTRKVELEL